MQRFHQLVFIISLLALCWFAMMAVHELGHVVGAIVTGGDVQRVVLYPLTISRTDVAPNPHPLIAVWLGPIVGCVLPLIAWWIVPRRFVLLRQLTMFFAGFCLLANGSYIAFGSMDRVGDCGEMLKHGSPLWTLLMFGAVAILVSLIMWHRLGSVKNFLNDPALVDPIMAYTLLAVLVTVILVEFVLSPM